MAGVPGAMAWRAYCCHSAGRCLQALQPGSLFRVLLYQVEERCEFRFQALIGFMVGLEKGCVVSK